MKSLLLIISMTGSPHEAYQQNASLTSPSQRNTRHHLIATIRKLLLAEKIPSPRLNIQLLRGVNYLKNDDTARTVRPKANHATRLEI